MTERIAKFIASSGIASRRGAEDLIARGRVCVNGVKIDTPATLVSDTDIVTVDGARVIPMSETQIYAFHKPLNTMTTTSDPMGRKTIYDCLPDEYKHLKYVGRLDYRTTGLLLMTNNGELARRLTLPNANIPRVYIAVVNGDDFARLEMARSGATIDGINYQPMKIDVMPDNKLRIEITEGKKNEIRIVLKRCGLPVRKLHRISYGAVTLGNLAVGKIEKLSQKMVDLILKSL